MPDPTIKPRNLGRPTKLEDVLCTDAEGNEVTVADQIVRSVAIGNFLYIAAEQAHVDRDRIRIWRNEGRQVLADLETGKRNWDELHANEQSYAVFTQRLMQAEASAEARLVEIGNNLAEGNVERQIVTIKQARQEGSGELVEVERVERTEHALPDAAMVRFMLGTRFRDRWRSGMELTGADGGPIVVEMTTAQKRQRAIDRLGEIAAKLNHEDAQAASG